ncbi:hypothetical protein ACFX19_013674 [Malus domestica]
MLGSSDRVLQVVGWDFWQQGLRLCVGRWVSSWVQGGATASGSMVWAQVCRQVMVQDFWVPVNLQIKSKSFIASDQEQRKTGLMRDGGAVVQASETAR